MIGEALRLIRVFHNLKQTEAAQQLQISQSHISEIERGIKAPTLDLLNRYGEIFEIPTSSILLFSENLKKPTGSSRFLTGKVIRLLQLIESRSGHADEP